MHPQARAEATRQRILDVSVELFKERGFGGTSLNQILRRANVTTGAFYYHFPSKDAVGFAIIDEVASRMEALRNAYLKSAGSGLESVIDMAFQLGVLLGQDQSYRVAAYLEHSMARHTRHGILDVAARIETFTNALARTISADELRAGVTPEAAARTMFTVIYGCLVMTDLLEGDIATRLAEGWRILLPGLVAPNLLAHFEDALSTIASRHQ